MGFLSEEAAAEGLERARSNAEVLRAQEEWEAAWQAHGLPTHPITADFIGPIFVPAPPAQLLEEPLRLRAADPQLWQVVYMDDIGMKVLTFDDDESAQAVLAQASAAVEGGTEDCGGLIVKGGEVVAERLCLKYMSKEDYLKFLERAQAPAPEWREGQDEAICRAVKERLEALTRVAAEIGRLKQEYEAKALSAPEVIYGRPSEAMIEFAALYPHYVCLSGCAGGERLGGEDTPPTPPPPRR